MSVHDAGSNNSKSGAAGDAVSGHGDKDATSAAKEAKANRYKRRVKKGSVKAGANKKRKGHHPPKSVHAAQPSEAADSAPALDAAPKSAPALDAAPAPTLDAAPKSASAPTLDAAPKSASAPTLAAAPTSGPEVVPVEDAAPVIVHPAEMTPSLHQGAVEGGNNEVNSGNINPEQSSKAVSAEPEQNSKAVSAEPEQNSKAVSAEPEQGSEAVSAELESEQNSKAVSAEPEQNSKAVSAEPVPVTKDVSVASVNKLDAADEVIAAKASPAAVLKSTADASSVVEASPAAEVVATKASPAADVIAAKVSPTADVVAAKDIPAAEAIAVAATVSDTAVSDAAVAVSEPAKPPLAVSVSVDAVDNRPAADASAKQATDTEGNASPVGQPSAAVATDKNASPVEQPASEVATEETKDPNYDLKAPARMPRRRTLANALRVLAVDAVEAAQSGHPGMPMGMADIAEVLWRDFLRHNPANPNWHNRDRFVLSNGHGSMLLYGLLHLTGYDLTIEDLKQFRQMGSKTPGHPEYGHTPGVETTTGPLGQGLANAVGMALSEKHLAAQYNRLNSKIIDHFTYVFAGDGCLMEGISHEACSLAGTLQLAKLIVFWDDNGISIDGDVKGWFSEDVVKRFEAYGWQVIAKVDGHRPAEIRDAIQSAQADAKRPTLICCQTSIGHGSPNKANTAQVHGAPLGAEEVAAMHEQLRWTHKSFEIPEDIHAGWQAKDTGARMQKIWDMQWQDYNTYHPQLAAQLERIWEKRLPAGWASAQRSLLRATQYDAANIATRQASRMWLEKNAPLLPEILGGAADVSDSVCTLWPGSRTLTAADASGNYLHYGVREFAMSAIASGLALHGGLLPFVGTYLVFSDYARNAIRMASLMRQRAIFVYSHDSIALGEDGPTHQPIEHIASLRLIPGLDVWRPADAVETMVAWQMAVERTDGPSSLILTRQKVPTLPRTEEQQADISRGAYVIFEPTAAATGIIISTGSEVQLAIEAAEQLQTQGYYLRVVSMPCCERFMLQDVNYQLKVMSPQLQQRISIECGTTDYWYQFIGAAGKAIGIDEFGASAKADDLLARYGFTVSRVTETIKQYLA